MYVDVAFTTDDIKPDGSPICGEELPVYYSNLNKSPPAKTWGLDLPVAKLDEVVQAPWGTLGVRIRPAEAVALTEDVAFCNTGEGPVAKLCWSPKFEAPCDSQGNIGKFSLLTIIKHYNIAALAAHAVNDPITRAVAMQHWLVSHTPRVSPLLISRLLIPSGVPYDIQWLRTVVDGFGLLGYVSHDCAFHLCRVKFGSHPTQITHEEILQLNAQKFMCFDGIQRMCLTPTSYRLALGASDGYAYIYDIDIEIKSMGEDLSDWKCRIRGSARNYLEPSPVCALKFMPGADGYIFAAGLGSGRILSCDIRLSGSISHHHYDYLIQQVTALHWAEEHNYLITAQQEGVILSPIHIESSRHNSHKALFPKTSVTSTSDWPESRKFWSDVLCPSWRSSERSKMIDLRATTCAQSANLCSFAFDGGTIMVGDVLMCDLRQYLDCQLYQWNFMSSEKIQDVFQVKSESGASTPTHMRDKSDTAVEGATYSAEAQALLTDARKSVERLMEKAARLASKHGIHVSQTSYVDHDRLLNDLKQNFDEDDCRAHVDRPAALSICAADAGHDYKVFAYGSHLGLVQIYTPDASSSSDGSP